MSTSLCKYAFLIVLELECNTFLVINLNKTKCCIYNSDKHILGRKQKQRDREININGILIVTPPFL